MKTFRNKDSFVAVYIKINMESFLAAGYRKMLSVVGRIWKVVRELCIYEVVTMTMIVPKVVQGVCR